MHTLALVAALLGLVDKGIYPELLDKVTLAPLAAKPLAPRLRFDPAHHLLTLSDGDDPLKLYPASGPATATTVGELTLADTARAELLPLGAVFSVGPAPAAQDRDHDGIVDRLDILVGAKKLLHNGARYIERYVSLRYPNGDVPRTEGVCTDTVIRSLRNAGIDLQAEVHDDILRAPRAYPMVEKVDPNINHRRVRTILPWFQRHFRTMPAGTPYLPGDVVFFDTFPSKPGPDHLGVVSDTVARSGQRAVINNWTDGATDAEMDLFSFVPVTHHFRLK